MKNLKKTIRAALGGLALILLAAGCADILNSPGAPEAKPGRITLTIGSGPARTVTPGMDQFEKITLSFAGRDGSADLAEADASAGSATVDLPVGAWDVTAKAYLQSADTTPAAASAAHVISWNGTTVTGDPAFILEPTGSGDGTLRYTVTVPGGLTLAGSGSRIRLEAGGEALDLNDSGFTGGVHPISATETNKSVSLAAGSYTVDILLVENGTGHTAVWRESAVIVSGLVTKIEFAPAAGNFLDPDLRAILTDITDSALIFGLTAFDEEGDIEITPDFHDPASPVLGIAVPAETEMVYFVLGKTMKHSITVGGTDSAYVTIPGGFTNGSTPGDDLVVFAVDTSDIAATGGTKEFTVTIANEGMAGVEVAVTVTVPAAKLGAGLYIDNGGSLTAVPGFVWTGLQSALDWLGTGAVDSTAYVILLEGDEEVTGSYIGKDGLTGVTITLRGLEEERAVYWDDQTQFSNGSNQNVIFVVKAGTTLVLDEYINLGGGSGGGYSQITGPYSGAYLVTIVANAAMEMLPGSKISGIQNAVLVSIGNESVFKMRGGTIEDNIVNSVGLVYFTNLNPHFEMFNGAEIKNNKVTGHSRALIRSLAAVSNTTLTGKFTMHGGAIKDNDMRGIYLINGAKFFMEGGEISGNGTGEYTNSVLGNKAYIWGAGVYYRGMSGARSSDMDITITGGSITNNGHANSLGGGMWLRTNNYGRMLIDGPVNFAGNNIYTTISYDYVASMYLGSSFSNLNDSPIVLESGRFDTYPTTQTPEYIFPYLNGCFVLQAAASNGANIASVVDQFELARMLFHNGDDNSNSDVDFAVYYCGVDITRIINSDGTVTLAVE
jgi:hypothetical protein